MINPLLTFNQHGTNVKNKLQARNSFLKTIEGSFGGKNKEFLAGVQQKTNFPLFQTITI